MFITLCLWVACSSEPVTARAPSRAWSARLRKGWLRGRARGRPPPTAGCGEGRTPGQSGISQLNKKVEPTNRDCTNVHSGTIAGRAPWGCSTPPNTLQRRAHAKNYERTGRGGCQMKTPSFIVRAKKIRFQVGKIGLVLVGEKTIADPRRRIRCLFTWTATTR